MLRPASIPWRYRSAGFTLASDIEFPQLLAEPTCGGPVDIRFERGDIPAGEGLHFARRNFGFSAVDARRVIASVSADATPLAVGLTVLTGGLNAVAYQRGLLPLHASAVAVGDACVAFCGDGGVGKSTLAASLAQSGFPMLSDDLVVVHFDTDGFPTAWPAITRPKLTRASIGMLRADLTELAPPNHWDLKTMTAVGATPSYVPRRLAALYLLAWGEPGLLRLSALEAASAMRECLRTPRWLEGSGEAESVRRHWLALVTKVPVFAACRPERANDFARFPDTLIGSWQRGSLEIAATPRLREVHILSSPTH